MRLYPLTAAILLGCTTVPPAATPAPTPDRTAARELRTLMSSSPRHGLLAITPETLQLRLGDERRSRPFLDLDRGFYQLACYVPSADEPDQIGEDAWWLFENGPAAVALQLGTSDVHAWFWDAQRDCHVRTAALKRSTDGVPSQYYKADDAQIAYRWNQSATPPGAFGRLPEADAPGVTGDETVDFLPSQEGAERLVVTSGFISIRTAAGRVVLQDQFEIDLDWACYDAQLTVFGEPDGGIYAISSFETFGTLTDCGATAGDTRYVSSISRWNPETAQFVSEYRLREELRPLHPGGEDSSIEVERVYDVAGGRLRVVRRTAKRYVEGTEQECVDFDRSTQTCLSKQECWRWSSSNQSDSEMTLYTHDGARIDLGSARSATREQDEECDD